MRSVVALVLVLLLPVTAVAEPCVRAVPLAVGDVARCDGTLVPDARLDAASACLVSELPACRLLLSAEQRKLSACETARLAERPLWLERVGRLEQQLAQTQAERDQALRALEDRRNDVWTWGAAGVGIGVALGAVALYALAVSR